MSARLSKRIAVGTASSMRRVHRRLDIRETATEGNGDIKRNCNRTFQSGEVPEGVT